MKSRTHRTCALALLAALTGCAGARALPAELDPTQTDGDKYHVLLENEHVRVLRYHDLPGDQTRLHQHPDFVIYALGPFRRRLIAPDGTQRVREFASGDIAWMPAQAHAGENVGSTPTECLLIEMKSR